jgi:hypothetical protein
LVVVVVVMVVMMMVVVVVVVVVMRAVRVHRIRAVGVRAVLGTNF